jgi:PAS domain S-box-containing protein
VEIAESLCDALKQAESGSFHVTILDLNLPDSAGLNTLTRLSREHPDMAVVVVTGAYDEEVGVEAIAHGAQEYLIKGYYDMETLGRSIRYAVERKQLDKELKLARERYQTVFENSAVAITVADEQERLVSWNHFTESMLGMDHDHLNLVPLKTLYPSKEWAKIRRLDIRQAGIQEHLETRMIKKGGELIDVDISLTVLKDSTGKPTGSIGVIRDITDRVKAQKIIKRKQKDLEAIFDAAPVGMLLLDDDLTVHRANDAVKRMVHKDYSQIVGHFIGHALNCVNTHDGRICGDGSACQICKFRNTVQGVRDSGRPMHMVETQATCRVDAELKPLWLAMSVEPVTLEDHTYMLLALNDITERKKAEERLKETMEIKSRFISNVSHELRTPLASMKESVAIVQEHVVGPLNEQQQKFLDIAKRNADRLADLINDVLDFQRLEAGRIELEITDNDLAELAAEVCETMTLFAEKSGVTLKLHCQEDLPPAQLDRNKIIQVMTNLISNAIKFTPSEGRVSVTFRQQDDELVIAVSDTGMGIPEEALGKIFDRFYRVTQPSQQIKGTGLGLAIVEKIVTMHNGRISVESEVDNGTTFTVFLPLDATFSSENPSAQADDLMEDTIGTAN